MKPQTWYGVIDPMGQLSQLFSMRGLAEAAMSGRGDRDKCRLAKARVEIEIVEPPAPKKGKRSCGAR